jgi:hypothetical protein
VTKWPLIGLYAILVICFSLVVNRRVCEAGLSECIRFSRPVEPLAYVATRRLAKGELVRATDLKAPRDCRQAP